MSFAARSWSKVGNCVEVAADAAGVPRLRESDDPGTVVTAFRAALAAFIRSVKAGELDHLAE